MNPRTRTPLRHDIAATLQAAFLVLAIGCAGGSAVGPPSVSWSQSAATQAAAAFHHQMSEVYETASKDPSFAGERSAYGHMLDNLRTLREESGELHAQLVDGKTRQQTLHTWERIKEAQRDAEESGDWAFLPSDFSSSARAALGSTDQLDQLYGTH
jgi:hypothetical protein